MSADTDTQLSIAAFRPHFPNSIKFRQACALIAATHALSFYSLTLQHGVPFQPVSIRVSSDPISLVDKVLEQNPRSYTKLDDLIGIAQNLVSAGLQQPDERQEGDGEDGLERKRKQAERRVTFMAIEAALREDDFETAYSYVVNRLTPSGADITAPAAAREQQHKRIDSTSSVRSSTSRSGPPNDDDISWRAAFLAGRYRPATSSPPTLRRLEQRTELLSLAMLMAPTSALTEILGVWRRCEEESMAMQRAERAAEEDFDDRADKQVSTGSSALPGHFSVGDQPERILGQARREIGRFGAGAANATFPSAAAGAGQQQQQKQTSDEAPMSMFDLTRSAARAFSRNAFPLRGSGLSVRSSSEMERPEGRGLEGSVESLGSEGSFGPGGSESGGQRVRKRDMLAGAVSGGLASGLGWVLGATPTGQGMHGERPGSRG
jgi:protein transport protein SEC39